MTSLSQHRASTKDATATHVVVMLFGAFIGAIVGAVVVSALWRDLSSCQRASVLVDACRESRGYTVRECTGTTEER